MDTGTDHLNTGEFLRYRLHKLLQLRDAEKARGRDVDRELVESIIQLCRELDTLRGDQA